MNFKYYIILSFFSLLISAKIVDRSDDIRPFWSREAPQGVYYNYYSGVGYSSKSLMDAKTLAESDVISSLLNSNEFSVKA